MRVAGVFIYRLAVCALLAAILTVQVIALRRSPPSIADLRRAYEIKDQKAQHTAVEKLMERRPQVIVEGSVSVEGDVKVDTSDMPLAVEVANQPLEVTHE